MLIGMPPPKKLELSLAPFLIAKAAAPARLRNDELSFGTRSSHAESRSGPSWSLLSLCSPSWLSPCYPSISFLPHP